MAMLAGEESMLAAFASGADIHTATAAAVFGLPPHMITPMLRSRAKAVNFGIIYGIGGFSLAKDIGVSVREAQNYIDSYFTRYPKIKIFREGLIEQAKQDGFAVTAFGRRRLLPELKSANRQLREFGERVATNMPIQGTAADIIKLAMVRVAERLRREGLQARLILQVHDELLVECPAVEELQASVILREEMEGAWTKTPLLAEVHSGTNWLLAK
jgi:DNA polymerase-1